MLQRYLLFPPLSASSNIVQVPKLSIQIESMLVSKSLLQCIFPTTNILLPCERFQAMSLELLHTIAGHDIYVSMIIADFVYFVVFGVINTLMHFIAFYAIIS